MRSADPSEISALAKVWHDAWRDAHADILPVELARLRTLESFAERIEAALSNLRATGPRGAPTGLCIIEGDELYQLFVAAEARGSGVADALIEDAEARLAAVGVETAWLGCAIG
ncbi:MAG: GNAT family N-acetyltransferase, partial [Maricaulaceae bacterium]